jgi:hypothetical protein
LNPILLDMLTYLGCFLAAGFAVGYFAYSPRCIGDTEVCGPPRKASALSQALYSRGRALRVMAGVVPVVCASIAGALAVASSMRMIAYLSYALAVVGFGLFAGGVTRLKRQSSTPLRIAVAAYHALAVSLFAFPELIAPDVWVTFS